MKNQYKVISILAGIVLSEGVFAEPSVGELYSRESSKSENTQTSYDQQKLAYLQEAQRLVDKYGNKPIPDWSENDRKKLDLLAKNIGTTEGHLFAELRLGNFNSLRDEFASTSTVLSSVETIENMNYKNIEGQISALTNEIKTQNQELTLDKMQQTDLKMSVNNLQDVNNTNKVTETQNNAVNTSTHESYWWEGGYTANYYGENNLGQPSGFAFGDGPAETRTEKPGPDKNLYLLNLQDYSVERTIILDKPEAEYFGAYNYVAWGTWSDPNADGYSKVYTSHWILVDQIDRDQKPKTGTATYLGNIQGTLWTIGQDNSAHNANGDISMTANFGTNAINGNMQVNNADTGAAFASATFNTNMTTSADGDGLKFDGHLTGQDISNQQDWHSAIRGEFGGNQAAEAGGTWAITKTDSAQIAPNGQATGVFRAEKQ